MSDYFAHRNICFKADTRAPYIHLHSISQDYISPRAVSVQFSDETLVWQRHLVPAGFHQQTRCHFIVVQHTSLLPPSSSSLQLKLNVAVPRVWQHVDLSHLFCTSYYSLHIRYLEPATSLFWPLFIRERIPWPLLTIFPPSTLWITVITECSAPKPQEAVVFWSGTSAINMRATSKVTLTTRRCQSNT